MDKDKYLQKIREFRDLIDVEKTTITQAERNIRNLEFELQRHRNSCNHKYEDGSSALKDTSYWNCVPSEYFNDWTGEMEEEDNGYSVRQETCQICGREE